MIQWVAERAPVGLGRVRWLGLFSESTTSACMANLYNQDACYTLCASSGIGAWSQLLVWPCVNQCMIEGCGSGILVSHTQMQTGVAKIGGCLSKCVADANKLEDPTARSVALQACPLTCNLAGAIDQAKKEEPVPQNPLKTPAKSSQKRGIAVAVGVLAVALIAGVATGVLE